MLNRYDARPLGEYAGLHLLVARDDLAGLLEEAAASNRPWAEAAGDVTAALFEKFAIDSGATSENLLVEKTPSHLFHTQRILRQFPDARIVEVLRDGRDVCVSMQYRAKEVSWPPKDRGEQILRWRDAVQFGMTVRGTPEAAGRWHVLRFEAAKDNPRRAIAELFTFCELPFDDAVVERVAEETDISHFEYRGDGEMIRRGAVGDWRTNFDDADQALFVQLAGDTLAAAGYHL